jgi:hypothetical protein
MSYTIRWNAPLTRTERRWLQGWLDRVAGPRPSLIERQRGAISVRAATPETAHTFAALTLTVIGRPRFAYTLTSRAAQVEAQAAA